MEWFEVDKNGLAKLLEKKGKSFAVTELIQNAWDQKVSRVIVTLKKSIDSLNEYKLSVEDDDPDGFADISHAYTLFAESIKKSDPTKRGRFNLGEKLVLAICHHAEISSTKGTVIFSKDGRNNIRRKRKKGSVFIGHITLSKKEYEEVCSSIGSLICPVGIHTEFNGEPVPIREPLKVFKVPLPTEISDNDGNLKPSKRKTNVEVHEVIGDESASIYEMGIPVVETGDKWHVNIQQKVPLNFNRDNVKPSYLKLVRALVLNEMAKDMEDDDSSEVWVDDALASKDIKEDAVERILDMRYGKKRVSFDPSDSEANKIAVSKGYSVIYGKEFSKDQWENIRKAKAVNPAGQVTPSAKVFNGNTPAKSPSKITEGMKNIAEFTKWLALELLDKNIHIQFVSEVKENCSAAYTKGLTSSSFIYNVARLGYKWFEGIGNKQLSLILHELGHEYCSDHLDEKYYDALTDLGAKVAIDVIPNNREKWFEYIGFKEVECI